MSTPQGLFFYGVQGERLADRPAGFGGPCPNTTYSFGDTHGNAIGLVRYFYDSGILQLSQQKFQTLINIYEVDNNKDYERSQLSAAQLASFREIIRDGFSRINLTGQVRYRCFGDLVGDRGSNDILSLIIFDELRYKYQNDRADASLLLLTILQSNHDKSLLLNYLLGNLQPGKKLQLEIYPEQCCSLLRFKDLIDKRIVNYDEVERMMQSVYLPALKLVDYVRNTDGSIDVMSHAPLSLPAINDAMRHLLPQEQHRNIYASVDNLVAVLDQLNARYKPKVVNGRLVFDEDIYQAIIAPPVTGLLDRFMWPRLQELKDDSSPPSASYKICFRHGHDGDPGVETNIHGIRYVGYNNNLGKATLLDGASVMTATLMRSADAPASDPSTIIAELERTLAATVAQRDAALLAGRTATAKANAIQTNITALEQQLREATAAVAARDAALTAERTATARARADTQAATDRIAAAQAATANTGAAEARVRELQQALTAATNACGAAQTRIAELEQALVTARAAARTANASVSAAQTRIITLGEQLREAAAVVAERDAAIKAARTATARAEAAQTRAVELERELAAAKATAQTATASASTVQTRVAQLDQELAAAKVVTQNSTASVNAAQTRISALQQQLREANAAHAAALTTEQIATASARASAQAATDRIASVTASAQTRVTELERLIVVATTERDHAVAAARAATARVMPSPTSSKKERSEVFAKIISLTPWRLGMYTGFTVTAIVGTGLAVYFIAPFAAPVIMTNFAALKAVILKFALEHTFLLPVVNTLASMANFSVQLLAPLANLLTNFVNLLANIVISGSTTKMAIGIKSLALTVGSGLCAGLVTTAVAQATTQTLSFLRSKHKPSHQASAPAITPAINSRSK